MSLSGIDILVLLQAICVSGGNEQAFGVHLWISNYLHVYTPQTRLYEQLLYSIDK